MRELPRETWNGAGEGADDVIGCHLNGNQMTREPVASPVIVASTTKPKLVNWFSNRGK